MPPCFHPKHKEMPLASWCVGWMLAWACLCFEWYEDIKLAHNFFSPFFCSSRPCRIGFYLVTLWNSAGLLPLTQALFLSWAVWQRFSLRLGTVPPTLSWKSQMYSVTLWWSSSNPIFLTPFVWMVSFFTGCFGLPCQNLVDHRCWMLTSGLSILFHWSVCLFLFQYQAVLIIVAL